MTPSHLTQPQSRATRSSPTSMCRSARTTIFHATHISVDDVETSTDYSVNVYAVSPVYSCSAILTVTTTDAQASSTKNPKTETPTTGDNASLPAAIALMLINLVATGIVIKKRK